MALTRTVAMEVPQNVLMDRMWDVKQRGLKGEPTVRHSQGQCPDGPVRRETE